MKILIIFVSFIFLTSCASRHMRVTPSGHEVELTEGSREIASMPIKYQYGGTTYYFHSENDKEVFVRKTQQRQKMMQQNSMGRERY